MEMLFLVLIIASILIVGNTENKNGRIQQCNDIGWRYTMTDGCISNSEYQMKYNNTKKQFINTKTFNEIYEMK
jgi:hypothetical protein